MRWFWQKDDKAGGGPEEARVPVYDFDTRQVHLIPAAELAPGMVRARLNGVEDEVWVDASRLQQNVHQQPPFPEEVRDLFRQLKAALDEVYPMSLEQWEDGFRRDSNPEPEIAYWLHLAQTYSRLVAPDAGLGATPERRLAVFKLLAGCGIAPRERVLGVAERGPLTREEAERVVDAFFDFPEEGS
jgi:hypothetical protein